MGRLGKGLSVGKFGIFLVWGFTGGDGGVGGGGEMLISWPKNALNAVLWLQNY